MPPLGLLYLASYVNRELFCDVKICDMEIGDNLLDYLKDFDPDIVGITALLFNWYDVLQILNFVKQYNPRIKTVIGGSLADMYPDEVSSYSQIDYIIRGEGERPLADLLLGHNNDRISKEGLNLNLDDLPFPARHLIDISRYSRLLSNKPSTNMMGSRNCPGRCIFCYQPRPFRYRSAKNIFSEMSFLYSQGIGDIVFNDDTFTWNRDRTLELCALLIGSKVLLDWSVLTRVDKVDPALLAKMKQAGVKRIKYGVESGSNDILHVLHKDIYREQTVQAISWTKEAGIEVEAYVILGSPGDTKSRMIETVSFVNNIINPDYVIYQVAIPAPKTLMYQRGLDEGRYEDYWREFAVHPKQHFSARPWEKDLNFLANMWKYAMYSFYCRPWYIVRRVIKIRTLKNLLLHIKTFWNLFDAKRHREFVKG